MNIRLATVGVLILVLTLLALYLYRPSNTVNAGSGIFDLRGDSVLAVEIQPPPEGSMKTLYVSIACSSNSSSAAAAAVYVDGKRTALIIAEPGKANSTSVSLEGAHSARVIVLSAASSSRGAYSVSLEYNVRALYTPYVSLSLPVALISGYLICAAGQGKRPVNIGASPSSKDEEESDGGREEESSLH